MQPKSDHLEEHCERPDKSDWEDIMGDMKEKEELVKVLQKTEHSWRQ